MFVQIVESLLSFISSSTIKGHGTDDMVFTIIILPQADGDIQYYRVPVQRLITDGIKLYLIQDADQETKRKKHLRSNRIAPWELRIDIYRVFYRVMNQTATVVAVGHKEHNRLYIRGVEVIL